MKPKTLNRFVALLCASALFSMTALAAASPGVKTTKQERNYLRAGNKLYNSKQYSEAEVEYRKALQANPQSPYAQFNLASALLRQGSGGQQPATGKQQQQQPSSQQQNEAVQLITDLAEHCPVNSIASKARYDLGNLAYKQQQYQQAVEMYKDALRKNPHYEEARYNLRMAQLKLKQQQQQNKNDKNQNKNKNQDKNKDQDKDKDKNQNKKQNQDKNQNRPHQEQQGGMSKENMEQVLRTMQNQENATRQRARQRKAQLQQGERLRTQHKW